MEIYFRFRFRQFARNLDIFLHHGHRISSKSEHPLRKYDVISISENGGRDGWILLPVSYLLMPSEGQSLLANQILWSYLPISGWDITTSGFEIQTSAILEFYFWFRSRPVRRNLHVILHQATEFRPNRSTHCGNMTSYPFLNMAAATAKYYFRFRICWCHCLQKVNVYQQISSRYLNCRLRYNYFRFRNANVRHN